MAMRRICFMQGHSNLKMKCFAFIVCKFIIWDSDVWEGKQKPSNLSDTEWITSCDNHETSNYSRLL